MPPMEDARASEEKYNEILNSGMPPRRRRSSRDARAMCGKGGLVFIQTKIRDRGRGTARSKKETRYRTGDYGHEAAWWANRDARVRRPLEISNKPI